MTCPICEGGPFEAFWTHSSGVSNGLCLSCGHVYLTGLDSADVVSTYADFAQSYSDAYLLDRTTPIFSYANARAQLLRRLKPGLSAVLEIGAGYGHFLHVLGAQIHRAGLEPSPVCAAFAGKQFGLEHIVVGSFEHVTPDWPNRKVDAVCAFHVVEHLHDLYAFLDFARARLTEDGLLVMAVPELQTLHPDLIELYFLRREWHLHTFSANTIRRLLAKGGFEIIHSTPEAQTPMLRSSILVVAKFTGRQDLPVPRPAVAAARAVLRRFHDRLESGLGALRERASQWRASGTRVAIYGAGMHTLALFDLADIDLSAIAFVIDDDPRKSGTSIKGIPCRSRSDAEALAPDVILVSTLASEDVLLESLPRRFGPDTQILGIYRDFIP